ncbi:MAG: hypothetical protein ACRDQA_08720, partial [Nocardioidaceae bacterium]
LSNDARLSDERPDLAQLRARVEAAWSAWQDSARRYSEVSALLPDLVADVQRIPHAFRSEEETSSRRQAHRIAADMYFLLRTFTKRIGRVDLSLLVADRGLRAAQDADDPLRIAAARWNLGHVLLAQDEPEAAEDVSVHATEDLRAELSHEDQAGAAMQGALWFVAIAGAVRAGDAWGARDRLREKAWPAARQVGDGNVMWTAFGPTNVGLHAVSVEMEAGEAAEALRLADDVDPSRSASIERRTTFALEVARAYEQRHDDAGAFVHLLNAEATGPEDVRYNILARDLVRGLMKRARPTYASQVSALAGRIGLVG